MFTPDQIQSRARQQPFVPFRITTSAGQTFEVRHPELIMVGRRDLSVGTASAENPLQYDNVTRIAIMHVTTLEDLPASAPSGGNGQQP
jgi:hypothetical protein